MSVKTVVSKRIFGFVLIAFGAVFLIAGFSLVGYNFWDSSQAGEQAQIILETVTEFQDNAIEIAEIPGEIMPEIHREMATVNIEGVKYIGTISIPAIDIVLPVQESWSLPALKKSPCRYQGSVYDRNLIICAHNYVTHFGLLKNLIPGDEVLFTTADGEVYSYLVSEIETLDKIAVDEMEAGDWDLTLFTCTIGGRMRVTVRCTALSEI